jgi:catechol 2,3-dioxygenase-like lactoylglutathione lyase family enzyme
MLDHVSIGVSDFERSKAFYDRALRPLGITHLYADGDQSAGYGISPRAFFWIGWRNTLRMGAHIAFTAQDRAAVDQFYDEALAAGGTNNGAPGLRPNYHPDYYGAFVLDPDGYNIEAVCHSRPSQPIEQLER